MNRDRFDWDKIRCEYHPKYGRETVVPYRKGVRVQHKRGKKLPPNTKYVGRPSRWGNPYKIGELYYNEDRKVTSLTLEDALFNYKTWMRIKILENSEFLYPLRGYDLACYCPLDQKCHADILLEALK